MDNTNDNNVLRQPSFLSTFVATHKSTSSTKEKYTLDQILTIFTLTKNGVSVPQMVKVVGHSKLSIGYKVRWLKKAFEKHGESTIAQLYQEFGVKLPESLEDDVTSRVESLIQAATSDQAS